MILILGGGFIGSAVYQNLRRLNYNVRLYSKSANSFVTPDYCKNISNIDEHPEVLKGVHTIINTIHTSVPATSFLNELYDVETNVLPFIKLLKHCEKNSVKKFIHISSGGAIYGQTIQHDELTETAATNPVSSYGITKLINEKYLILNRDIFEEGIAILRPSNIYGKNQQLIKPQGVIGYLINSAINNVPFTVWGDGTANKDYLYLSDLTEAIKQVVDSDLSTLPIIYNVSSGKNYSIFELIDVIENLTNTKIKVDFDKKKPFDVHHVKLSNKLFKSTFNWTPKMNIEEGIGQIVQNLSLNV